MTLWRTPRWLATSVRNKLLAMALLPLLVAFPLLVLALAIWSNQAYDRLLITKVRSDLAVARGYFDQVLTEVGSGTRGVADSRALADAWRIRGGAGRSGDALSDVLASERERLGLDFLVLYDNLGQPIARGAPTGQRLEDQQAPMQALPRALAASLQMQRGRAQASLLSIDAAALEAVAPHLASRLRIPLVPTRNAAPTQRSVEDRAMVALTSLPVLDAQGRTLGLLSGGLLLNQNLEFIDHINRIVYPQDSLPFGSQGTATLFLDDVRITTNVRLFQDQRAIGTRVSQTVRDAVLGRGETWLQRAFVVNEIGRASCRERVWLLV